LGSLNYKISFIGLVILIAIFSYINLFVFPNYISPYQSWTNSNNFFVFNEFRLPKTLTAIFVGAALSLSGLILQQLFKNKLAGPYVLGVSSGASLFVEISIIGASIFNVQLLSQSYSISMAGLMGALLVILLLIAVSKKTGFSHTILLFGVVLSQIIGACQVFLDYLANPNELKLFSLWTMGTFSNVNNVQLVFLSSVILIGLIWAFYLMKPLQTFILGEDIAKTLGVNTKSVSIQLMLCTGVLTGVSTAFCGPIAFIGMAIPNLVKLMFKTSNHQVLFWFSILLGSLMALICDTVGNSNWFSVQLPINVTSSMIGGPFILYILLSKKQ